MTISAVNGLRYLLYKFIEKHGVIRGTDHYSAYVTTHNRELNQFRPNALERAYCLLSVGTQNNPIRAENASGNSHDLLSRQPLNYGA
jgi:hypothetical protein